jgi:hypothetical protein
MAFSLCSKLKAWFMACIIGLFLRLHCNATVQRKGVIAALIRAFPSTKQYDTIIRRNKAVFHHLYWNPNDKSSVVVVLFHEGNLPQDHQNYIQNATPELPLQFVDVGEVFRSYKNVDVPICPKNKMISMMFQPGYYSMCYFWFLRFDRYLKDYDWMLRLDDDCILVKDVRYNVQQMPATVHFASALWVNLAQGTSDAIRPHDEGAVVVGMRNLTIQFAQEHKLFNDIHSWHAPYTNAMYIDLNWLRNHNVIQAYRQRVEDSQCIYSNRWGDLPLWGAAIYLSKEPRYHLHLAYFHGTHNTLVNGTSTIAPQNNF